MQLSMRGLPEYEFFAVQCIVSIQRWLVWSSSWRSYISALSKDLLPYMYVVLDEEQMVAVPDSNLMEIRMRTAYVLKVYWSVH